MFVACERRRIFSVTGSAVPWVPEDIFFLSILMVRSFRSRVNEEKNNLWSQEYATSFPCEKSVQNLNWVTDWILPCPQGINNIIMAMIGYIEQLEMGVSNR